LWCRCALLVIALASLASCSGEQVAAMQFHRDNRLEFTSPPARERVDLPLRVAWRFDGDLGSNAFGVFVDRSPIGVAEPLKSVASGDRSCELDPTCPDEAYLANIGVYVTTKPELELSTLPRVGGVGDEQHTITVVLLDKARVRRTESHWYVEFRLARRG
jgi:hypothetical protein